MGLRASRVSVAVLVREFMPTSVRSADIARRREPEEKGPFGRSTRRRGFSRSKTATPARKEDAVRLENMGIEDAIFAKYKEEQREKSTAQQQKTGAPISSIDPTSGASTQTPSTAEPTEVTLYGYGTDQEWAAIDFYERISGGCIYEDYDRHPPHVKYDLSLSYSRAKAQRSLSAAALRKRNTYRGGDHWIKVTFDSPVAAEMAISQSPHILHGHLVYAEPFVGRGPSKDAPIPATNAGAQIDSLSLPKTFSTHTGAIPDLGGSPTGSSNTVSSATATAPAGHNDELVAQPQGASSALAQQQAPRERPLRIAGATRAVLLPPEQAFLPSQPRYTHVLASLPIINLFVGGKGDGRGELVPRTEDGGFDWKNASLYWKFFAWLDMWLGTDFCGLRGED